MYTANLKILVNKCLAAKIGVVKRMVTRVSKVWERIYNHFRIVYPCFLRKPWNYKILLCNLQLCRLLISYNVTSAFSFLVLNYSLPKLIRFSKGINCNMYNICHNNCNIYIYIYRICKHVYIKTTPHYPGHGLP